MPFLDAALAFALTMLVVATAVTQILRIFKNTAKLRSAELQKMLKEYVDNEIEPVVKREWNRLKENATDKLDAALETAAKNLDESKLFEPGELAKLLEVSTEELTERLKQSEFGQRLLKELGDQAQAVFDQLGRRYEAIGNKFTASFRTSSRLWGTCIAFVLALAFNIDSIYIADSYIKNVSMRQGVIAQKDALLKDRDALVEVLEKEENQDSVATEDLADAIKKSRGQIDVLTSVGLPIGWSYCPQSNWWQPDYGHLKSKNECEDSKGWVDWRAPKWLLGIFLTALLAGLGAPFWYDAVAGISRVAQGARGAKKPTP